MAHQQPTRHSILPSSSSHHSHSSSSSQFNTAQTALQQRINSKRTELHHLQQLRTLSAQLATNMSELEAKVATLRDGAEAVSLVMGNWEGVLGVIAMAGQAAGGYAKTKEEQNGDQVVEGYGPELPVTLVRIPVERKVDGSEGG